MDTVTVRELPLDERRRYFALKQKAWRLMHPERASEIQKRYYQNHREEKIEAVHQYQLQRKNVSCV